MKKRKKSAAARSQKRTNRMEARSDEHLVIPRDARPVGKMMPARFALDAMMRENIDRLETWHENY